jgi:uncharacterized SAM-binding protein YcdF (DUF218 family)
VFYAASKIGWFLATPSNLLPLLVAVGLGLMAVPRTKRFGYRLAVLGVVLLFAAGLSPLANAVILPLETRFPTFEDDGRPVSGIIVLGGSIQAAESIAHNQLAVNEAGERAIAMADLARRYPDARLVFSGGGGTLLQDEPAEAEAARRFAPTLGFPPERLMVEGRSLTTAQNAAFTRDLVKPQAGERWLLVTSAWHMPRAIGCFRKAGFAVIAYPVDFRTQGPGDILRPFAFMSDGLRRLDLAAKEWAGLVAYWLTGRTSELFPGPASDSGSAIR